REAPLPLSIKPRDRKYKAKSKAKYADSNLRYSEIIAEHYHVSDNFIGIITIVRKVGV
ncbi:hypothetical protein EVA_16765, partial [gut metagenome]